MTAFWFAVGVAAFLWWCRWRIRRARVRRDWERYRRWMD